MIVIFVGSANTIHSAGMVVQINNGEPPKELVEAIVRAIEGKSEPKPATKRVERDIALDG